MYTTEAVVRPCLVQREGIGLCFTLLLEECNCLNINTPDLKKPGCSEVTGPIGKTYSYRRALR